ncbi:MAG: sce7726 family protein [Aquabacterium sp.]|uniref:sce7726 family protein n=1 Tax=Aquabacterium sp. TaxID=1872578 RepID=UPI0027190DB8|nr:sce7726 family protein [Aquabacterium sp.]MDO9006454.1 sce7726 family protein [Aquabacterium sp.]
MTESDIRRALIAKLSSSPSGQGAAFIAEMFVDSFARRADLIMANGKLSAFEIKSSRDSLERLDGQLESYLRFFEQVTVVCAVKHLRGAQAQCPGDVGIWSISDDGAITVVRKAKVRTVPDNASWMSFLPVDELRALAKLQKVKVTGGRPEIVKALQAMPTRVARAYVLDYLKRRELRIQAIQDKRQSLRLSTVQSIDRQQRRLAELVRYGEALGATKAIPRLVLP